ncbi:MAG: carbohydrate ABC transporter permease [Actinomycetes bacterium]
MTTTTLDSGQTSEAKPVVRRRPRFTWTNIGLVVGVLFIAVYCLAPFYWMVVSSLKAPDAIFNNDLWPAQVSFDNFRAVFSGKNNFGYALRNSVIIATTSTLLGMTIGIFTAYALARLQFRGKFLVLGAVLATAMFPGVAIVTPLFQLFSDLGWINQYQAMILPNISFTLPLAIWILTSFFAEMPWELEQAAKVDGCTPGQAFRHVILPLAAPGVFTAAILVFIYAWNEYLIASQVSQTLASEPVTVAIAKFTGESQFQQPFGTQMAAGVVVTIPLVIMVLIFQRRIVAGLTAGGVKG